MGTAKAQHNLRSVRGIILVLSCLSCLSSSSWAEANDLRAFPDGFLFGTSSAAYQVEGAWNESGKGENIWDHFVHTQPDLIADRSSGDIACDSYHKYKEDVAVTKNMGMDVYRFSLSWSRILPTGAIDNINPDGIQYYNNLINELLSQGIKPLVTLYHWDLPQPLQEIGGWPNAVLADYFEDFAKVAFENFGDKVKMWLTFNEPHETCVTGYGSGTAAPGMHSDGVGDYLCAHTILLAHARAYRMYHRDFAASQKGKVGITLNAHWFEPHNASSEEDLLASERAQQFMLGWFAHPIFSKTGDYPAVMKQHIMANSLAEGRSRSRLPTFTKEQVDMIRGTYDFFGLNHYTSYIATPLTTAQGPLKVSRLRDLAALNSQDPSWPSSASSWLKVVPWGFSKLLVWIKEEYGNPPLIVTENGFSDYGELEDIGRVNYYTSYLEALLKAVHVDKCNIFGYCAWSLLDNFEWTDGYNARFGLHYVNFSDPSRPRVPKASAKLFQEITKTRRLPLMRSVPTDDCSDHLDAEAVDKISVP